MSHRPSWPRLSTALLLACLGVSAAAGAAAERRIVAVGDIHGAYEEFVEILETAGLLDAEMNWIGVDSRFVQTGDFTDRGSRVRDTMELLLRIQRQAAERGGEVHILLGNHEAMNLIGEERDAVINPEIAASFADDRSEKRRNAAFKKWERWRRDRERIEKLLREKFELESRPELDAFIGQTREEWMAAHPPGLLEYREAMSVDGRYGRWLASLPVAVTVGDTLFLHGGIAASVAGRTLDEITRAHHDRIEELAVERKKLERQGLLLPSFSWSQMRLALEHQIRFPASQPQLELAQGAWDLGNTLIDELFAADSPLWFRGYAETPLGFDDEQLAALLDQTDQAYGVTRTVAAHSPLAGHTILNRLDGRLFLIDTGMLSSYYGGRPSALEISTAGISEIYPEPADGEAALGTNGRESDADDGSLGTNGHGSDPDETSLGTNGHGAADPQDPATETDEASSPAAAPAPRIFYGADGEPLPFQELDAIERFLHDANVLSLKLVGQGKSGARKAVLELGGTRAHGVFHTIDDSRGSPTRPVVLDDGSKVMYFRDSYRGQVAAYELSKLMGMTNVPPAVERKIGRETGSLALWIENGTNLFGFRDEVGDDPKSPHLYLQMHDMRVFDALVANTDRNSQNIFWTDGFDMWFIDHTRTMSQTRDLVRPDRVRRCSRAMLAALRSLDPKEVEKHLKPYASKFEIKALFKRREKLVALIEQRIRERGEHKVLFDADRGPVVSYSESNGPSGAE